MSWFKDTWDKITGAEQKAPVPIEPEARAVQQEMVEPVVAESVQATPDLEPEQAQYPSEPVLSTRKQAKQPKPKLNGEPRKTRADKGKKRGPRKPKAAKLPPGEQTS